MVSQQISPIFYLKIPSASYHVAMVMGRSLGPGLNEYSDSDSDSWVLVDSKDSWARVLEMIEPRVLIFFIEKIT